MAIVFELYMPHSGSWNGKWTGEGRNYIRTMDQRKVPKEYWNKDFYYRWDDGWEACVSVRQCDSSTARKLERKSDGFCGYDWMIRSIVKHGQILTESEQENLKNELLKHETYNCNK